MERGHTLSVSRRFRCQVNGLMGVIATLSRFN
ncbi:conserved hypothetical protein [Escherichia coli H591]|nr:conserved hypothetical protein [Escherichia coli H591]